MQNITNFNPFSTYRTTTKNGKNYLVVNGVSIIEGVLNKYFVSMDEFGAFVSDWNGVPLVLRHPKENNGSARVPIPDVPVIGNFYGAMLDSDNRRLIGEYWFDETALLATNEGKDIYDSILAGKIIETSTGYYANLENNPGNYNGLPYIGIQREIHPDHIAVLPDEIGACSIRDGCGINRNSDQLLQSNKTKSCVTANCGECTMKIANMTGNLPVEGKAIYEKVYKKAIDDGDDEKTAAKKAWGACKRAGWHKKDDEWIKKNYAIYENADDAIDISSKSMIAYNLPDDLRKKIKEIFPFIKDEIYNNLHLTLAFLGETAEVNIIRTLQSMFDVAEYQNKVEGQIQGLARFISGGDQDVFVLTYDSPDLPELHRKLSQELIWKGVRIPGEHGFIPHITLAYIGKDDDLPSNTFTPFGMTITDIELVNGGQTFIKVPLQEMNGIGQAPSHNNWLVNQFARKPKKENKLMDEIKAMVQKILNSVGWNVQFDDAAKNASATQNITSPSPTLTGLESVINKLGGVEKFAELLVNLQAIPASVQALSTAVKGIETSVQAASQMAQNLASAAETEKKEIVARLVANDACPLDEATLNGINMDSLRKLEQSYLPTNYAAMGGFVPNSSTNIDAEDVLPLPSYVDATGAKVEK